MDTVDTRSTSVPEDGEKIIEIQLERLRTFKNHPFKVRMDPEMIRLSASVEKYGIRTIGELARTDPDFLERQLGKMGLVIYSFANGWDDSPVSAEGYQAPICTMKRLKH